MSSEMFVYYAQYGIRSIKINFIELISEALSLLASCEDEIEPLLLPKFCIVFTLAALILSRHLLLLALVLDFHSLKLESGYADTERYVFYRVIFISWWKWLVWQSTRFIMFVDACYVWLLITTLRALCNKSLRCRWISICRVFWVEWFKDACALCATSRERAKRKIFELKYSLLDFTNLYFSVHERATLALYVRVWIDDMALTLLS